MRSFSRSVTWMDTAGTGCEPDDGRSEEVVEGWAVIGALPHPAVLVGRDGRVVAANAAADALFGLALAGRHHVAVLRQPDLLDAIAAGLAGAGPREIRYRTRDGAGDRVFRVAVARVEGRGGGVLAAFEDMTPFEAAGQMRRDFVANVSHELKTPLTAMLGFIETLRSAARDDPAARERFLGIMEREARRMDRLVSDLLSLSRVEDEERVRLRQPVDLSTVARRTVATLKALVEAHGADLVLEGADAPLVAAGDADQLQQVIANLVENAVKYGRPRGRVVLRLSRQGDLARLDVLDQGEGIDPVHIPRLTERFYRVDTHRSRDSGGTGLGLAIVKHIVNRHRGRLEISSVQGEGSCFSVFLPADNPATT
jgi:two-component system phosphate regulon sensor histidine kinase PhoR